MTSFEDSLDLICGLLTKAQKSIQEKPLYYRPIYNVYYMIIYVAIQDSLKYKKIKSNARNKTDLRYRNKKDLGRRKEAKDWLLNSSDCKLMWEIISDVDFSIFEAALLKTYANFEYSSPMYGTFNFRSDLARTANNKLRGYSL